MKKVLLVCGLFVLVALSQPSTSQVLTGEVTVKWKDRFCLFGGSVCQKVKVIVKP